MDGRVLKQIKAEYTEHMNSDPEIRQLFALMQKGKTAKQPLGLQLAAKSGDSMTDTLLHVLIPELGPGETIALSDAMAIVPDALRTNYDFVSSYLYQLQTKLDQQAGIGLKPLTAPFDADRAAGLAEEMTKGPLEEIADGFRQQVKNFSMHTVDESMQLTAESRSNAGLEVLVTRTYDDVGLSGGRECEWCKERECHDMPYQEAYELGVFERHPGCGCMITYTNSRGDTTYQANKGAWYKSSKEALEQRKNYGL